MSRSLLGAGLGATGATLYLKPEIVQDWARELMFGPSPRPAAGGRELEQLQRLVCAAATCRALRLRGDMPATPSLPCAVNPCFPGPFHPCTHARWRTCRARWPPAKRRG